MRPKDYETLERVKRWPGLLKRFTHVCVFSVEHQAFWREQGAGYTVNPGDAWILPFAIAFGKTRHCGKEKGIRFYNAVRCQGSWPMDCCPHVEGHVELARAAIAKAKGTK